MAEEPKAPEAAESAKTEEKKSGELILPLRKIVQAHGDEIKELKFREPTGGDIERVGNPVLMDVMSPELKFTFDSKAMTQMMSLLANVPPSTIRQLHPKDWNGGAWLIANFFIPDLA